MLAIGRAEQGSGLGPPLPWGQQGGLSILPRRVPWAQPAPPGVQPSHPGCLCALKTMFALSGVRKKYPDMVEKIYLHTLVGRKGGGQSLNGGASQVPSHPELSRWDREGKEAWEEAQL